MLFLRMWEKTGLALGGVKDLKPVWVREGEEGVEVLSAHIFVRKMKIRCCVAYNPQECDSIENTETKENNFIILDLQKDLKKCKENKLQTKSQYIQCAKKIKVKNWRSRAERY